MRWIVFAVVVASMLVVGVSQAQVQEEGPVIEIIKQVTEIDFINAQEIFGEIHKPETVFGTVKGQAAFEPQLWVRQSFLPEVMGTASML